MTAEAFNLLDPIHFLNVIFFIGAAVGIPLALKDSSRQTKNIFKYVLVAAILYHEITNPFFKITERGFDWWDAMPLHMCAFSTWCIAAAIHHVEKAHICSGIASHQSNPLSVILKKGFVIS